MKQENYFDHDADIGIIGRGTTLEAAFENAAVSTFAIMANLAMVKPREEINISFEETDVELALVIWLNSLLGNARDKGLILNKFKLEHPKPHLWIGTGWGEPWRNEIEPGVEVKGATLTMLSVKENNGLWEVRCVVDV